MGCLVIVVPMGRYSSCSKSTRCRSAMCRCCGQSLPCVSPSSKILVSKVCSSESSEQRLLGSSRGMRLRQGGKQGRKSSFKEESLRRFVTDLVLCTSAQAVGVMQGKDGPSSEADSLRASPTKISGGAHPLREESSRVRYRDGHDGGAFASWDGRRVVQKSSADESTWLGPAGREMVRKSGVRCFHPLDERLRKAGRLSYSWTIEGSSQDGAGIFQDRVLGGGSEALERGADSGNEEAKNHIPRQYSSNIPRSELVKIEELRFCGDMQEGDSGPQVLNIQTLEVPPSLQRALFWLGHLPGLSLTGKLTDIPVFLILLSYLAWSSVFGAELPRFWLSPSIAPDLHWSTYGFLTECFPLIFNFVEALWLSESFFGPETTRALQEFHYSNGFSSPGVWGFHSQQLLWNHLYPATNQNHPERQMPEISQSELKESPHFDLLESWRLVKNASGNTIYDGLRASRALQRRHSKTLREFVASISSSLPCQNVVSQRVGVLFLTVAVLSILVKVLHFSFSQVHGQPVRKRVMSWRNGVDWRRNWKSNQSLLHVQQRHPGFSEGGKILRYFQNHLGPLSTEKERTGCNLLDRLVLFDGQVVHGDYPTIGKMRQSTHSQRGLIVEKSMEDTVEGKLLPGLSHKQVHHSCSRLEVERKSQGFGQFQKLERDPARKVSSHTSSPVQSEKSHQLTGGDQLRSGRSPGPGWASWIRLFLALFFPNTKRLPYSRPKASSRRAVVRNTSRRTKSPERGAPADSGLHLRSPKFDDGFAAETQTQTWKDKNETDLKKRVEELHRTVQSVEQTRVAAMRALAEEKMHNLDLEVKIRRQNEAAAALEEEVRVLKDSHEALLASLKKKYGSSAAARAAAALLYQNWDPSDFNARV